MTTMTMLNGDGTTPKMTNKKNEEKKKDSAFSDIQTITKFNRFIALHTLLRSSQSQDMIVIVIVAVVVVRAVPKASQQASATPINISSCWEAIVWHL